METWGCRLFKPVFLDGSYWHFNGKLDLLLMHVPDCEVFKHQLGLEDHPLLCGQRSSPKNVASRILTIDEILGILPSFSRQAESNPSLVKM